MSLTRIGSIGINTGIAFAGVTTIVTLNTANDALSIGATVNVGSGNLTVGSGVTISSDGDGFFTGVITATSYSGIDLSDVTGATGDFSIADKIVHTGDTNTAIRFPEADHISLETAGSERLRLNYQYLIKGHTTVYPIAGHYPSVQLTGTTFNDATLSLINNANDATGSYIYLSKQRSGSQGGATVVQDDDLVGQIGWTAGDGTDVTSRIAEIKGMIDGTPGSNDTPGRLSFWTTADGAQSSTERLRIDSSGRIGIQGSPTKGVLDVRASGGSATMLTAVFGANEGQSGGTLSDNTDKACRIGSYHYDIDEEPFGILVASGTNGTNNLTFGGGTSLMNAATEIKFNTAANSTTTAGTNRLTIDSTGRTLLGSGAIGGTKITGPGGLDVSQYGLSICMGGSSGSSGQARANSTQKEARLVIPHYTNAEEPMIAIAAFASSASNQLNFGGGTSLGNAATEILFHTASNTTTTGASQKLKIGSDGKITVTSPAIIHSGSSAGYLELYGGATNHGGKILMNGGSDDATIRFYSQTNTSSPAERLRIDSIRVLHNCTANNGGASSGVYVQEYLGHVYNAIKIRDTANTGTANVLVMIAGSSVSGTITQNGSSASFNTSSDYRLKENEVEISDGISRVKNLKPYKFNWKSDPTKIVDGFFAHEAQAVVPESVTGEKDEVADSDIDGKGVKAGDAIYQVMDHSKLVPLLTAALKEAISKIEVLETKVAALEG